MFFLVFRTDPSNWKINEFTIDYICKKGFSQNLDSDFSRSKRLYQTVRKGSFRKVYRYLNKSYFETILINGEKCRRSYLVYSQSKGAVFCVPCYLFKNSSEFSIKGFSDWKRPKSINKHENSISHKTCVMKMKNRSTNLNRVDKTLQYQVETEKMYWKNVLTRVCAVVKSLSSRGLPFRGDNEQFGSLHNGNFMMCLELIAEFDPFLAKHISTHGNHGKGHTNYLSHFTYEKFIKLMAVEVQNKIVEEIISARYFSIIIDSTPDIGHVDQLSFIFRYVNRDGLPVERFLCFLENVGHKSQNMAEAVFSTLKKYNLDISRLRGQSYDNAKNMSGIYSGLQARIKEVAPLADFIPCSAHSLNLVGSYAASCCKEANSFFYFVQNVYTFFSASTHRWDLLKVNSTLKNLSETRWSARDDACKALNDNWESVKQTLVGISSINSNEKSNTCNEARGLLRTMNRFETTFMSIFWGDLLHRFNIVSNLLQSVDVDICTVCEHYNTLIKYVSNLRNNEMFLQYQKKTLTKCDVNEYETSSKRKKIRKKQNDEIAYVEEVNLCGHLEFKVNTYYIICDNTIEELTTRKLAYDNVITKYSFFTKLKNMKTSEVYSSAENLYSMYKNDLDKTFINECIHFQSHIQNLKDYPKSIIDMSIMMKNHELEDIYPYVNIALRMFLCTPATNCTAERSFSTLRRVKTYLRSSISADRLNALAILNIESQLTVKINYSNIIEDFSNNQARKKLH